ncbi:unnamed protein product [Closterium sp. NIES-65]|nr:unnamed protein product [Closterium sp. NIES-65]
MTDSPGFLRLPGSLWAANGGQDNAGEGVIVGVIDTGVWPEHPSFANTPSNPYSPVPRRWRGICQATRGFPQSLCSRKFIGARFFPPTPTPLPPRFLSHLPLRLFPPTQPSNKYGPVPRRWRGKCQATRDFPQSLCSRKLIGARFFAAGVRKSSAGVNKEKDFMSPRDGDGHGTWCASAAAGNANVPLTLSSSRTLGSISGVAPRARLATYKALWFNPGGKAGAFHAAAGNANVPLTLSPTRTHPTEGRRHGAAAGNANVPLTLSPTRTLGTISGVAPRARLATYKALWVTPGGEAGAFQSDIRAAVDAAVSDGVDVLSCSYGGAISRYFNDLPYLQALKAGVFIALAAGNSGAPSKGQMIGTLSNTAPFYLTVGARYFNDLPYLQALKAGVFIAFAAGNSGAPSKGQMIGTPSNMAPFCLTVGASTIGRDYQANLTLGNGVQLTGLGFGSGGNARGLPLVLSSAALHPLGTLSLVRGGRVTQARECFTSSLDKAKLSGRMLVCNLKTRDVTEAMKDSTTTALGAAAMLLLSTPANLPCHARECFASSLDKSKLSGRMLVCNLKTRDPHTSLSALFTTFSSQAKPPQRPFSPPQARLSTPSSHSLSPLPLPAPFPTKPHQCTDPPINPAFPVTPRLPASHLPWGSDLWVKLRPAARLSTPPSSSLIPCLSPLSRLSFLGGLRRGREAGTWRGREAGTWRGREAGTWRGREAGTWRGREAGTWRGREAGTWRGREAGTWRGREAGTGRGREAGTWRGREAGTWRGREAGTWRGREAGTWRGREAGTWRGRGGTWRGREAGTWRGREAGTWRGREAGTWRGREAGTPTASLSPPFTTFSDEAPSVAYFSSTGPPLNPAFPITPRLLASNDILKPDIIGPGFQLWAASSGLTPSSSSEPPKFAYLSGTSMATPHLAGIAALIIQKNPNWSPAQIASAIMTTAYTTNKLGNPIRRTTSSGKKSSGKTVEATPWDMGCWGNPAGESVQSQPSVDLHLAALETGGGKACGEECRRGGRDLQGDNKGA